MRPSLRLGTISGIDIGIHWSILFIGFLLVTTLTGTILPSLVPGLGGSTYLAAALITAALFLSSIVAHELGHSIVAQRNGIEVRSITLFALGGVASLERDPDDPGAAARIALAGPAVSVAIGVGSLAAASLLGGVTLGGGLTTGGLITAALTWLGIINLTLAVFNMIPALPLDGGRVLQAALWKRGGERHRATISAAKFGRFFGWALVAFGLWQFFATGVGLWTALIGWFVLAGAKAESTRARWELRRRQMMDQGQWPVDWRRLFTTPVDPDTRPDNRTSPPPGFGFDPTGRDDVIDVTGRPVSDDPTGRPVQSRHDLDRVL